ncbi:MAG: helix-turn-helix transcriptional regulator, partial [Prosthecobacter sp.]|nr:helix-turn-helix transcriptional regulator [Prosthecobacter sp.]
MRYIRRSQRLDEELDIIEDDCPLPPFIDSPQPSYRTPKPKISIRVQSFTDGWRLLVGASSFITTESGASGSFGVDLALNEITEEAVQRPTRQLLDLISNIEKTLGTSILVVSPSHRLIGATSLGIETAERLASTSVKRGELLAPPLLGILQTAASQKSQIPYQHNIETSGQSLTIWVAPLPSKNHRLLVIQPESKTSPQEKALETLSKREQEVLKCLQEGKSNDEIATSLSISPNTVKNHLDRVFKKLGVTNRFAAA